MSESGQPHLPCRRDWSFSTVASWVQKATRLCCRYFSLIRQVLPLNDQRAIKSDKKLARLWDDAESSKQEPGKDFIAESLVTILLLSGDENSS